MSAAAAARILAHYPARSALWGARMVASPACVLTYERDDAGRCWHLLEGGQPCAIALSTDQMVLAARGASNWPAIRLEHFPSRA
ncbi:MAG: hypothetical protein ACYCZI_05580 [Metallibacterium scheffleri]|uniref:Uncharacterized protein n=1 Tax=Metallibacterium scheffleri TaxID=993689 RepID=A0A4S3KKG6_9GAMM|nr:hypothetical protein [Metallibacterium scheffleri]THD09317.1 hypothetical protein B1806_11335 [Metallibacterium scheffleri]